MIKALANLVESSGGGVWLRDANGAYSQQARLNIPPSGMQEQEVAVLQLSAGERVDRQFPEERSGGLFVLQQVSRRRIGCRISPTCG